MPFAGCSGSGCSRRIWLGDPRSDADETLNKSEAIRNPSTWAVSFKRCGDCKVFVCDKCAKGGVRCPQCGGELRNVRVTSAGHMEWK